MIGDLIVVLIILVAFGIIVWAVINYLKIPQPWQGLVILVVIIIGVLLALQRLGVVNVGSL